MGQATVELPDPLQQDNAAASSGSADDLLAQLAGEEIDRILADTQEPAKAETPAAPVASAPASESAPGPAAADAQHTIGNQLDALFHSLNETPAESEAAAREQESSPTAAQLDEQLAEQARQVVPQAPGSEETPAAAGKPAEATPAATVEKTAAKAVEAASASTTPATEAEQTTKDAAALNQLLNEDADSAGTPLILKPLVWLNAPIASLSSGARDTVGKIAILTMANAIAILIYVLVFRKP